MSTLPEENLEELESENFDKFREDPLGYVRELYASPRLDQTNIPSSVPTDPEFYRGELSERFKPKLGLTDLARAGAGGLTDLFLSTAEGLSAFSGNRELANRVGRMRDHVQDFFTGDIPDEIKQKFLFKTANAVGMMPGYVAMAIGTGGTGVVVKGASWLGLGMNAYQQGRDDYIASTGDPDRDLSESEFEKANQIGNITALPIMVLNHFGGTQVANAIFRGANTVTARTALQRVQSMAKPIVAEGITEGTQQFTQNLIAKELAGYDPDRELDSGVIESMIIGGIASGAYTVPTQMYQFDRLNEGIQKGEINGQELNDDLGRKLMETAVISDGVPRTGTDELGKIHEAGSVKSFIDNTLVPLTTKLSKAGGEYTGAFREAERQLGVQQGQAQKIIEPFIKKLEELKKLDPEDYETLADALVNASILSKSATTAESQGDQVQDNLDKTVDAQDTIEIDPTLPVGTEISEKFDIDGTVTTRNIRGLTQEEVEQGIDPQDLTKKYQGVLNSVNNAKQAIVSIMPDTTIALHKTTKEFKEATGVEDDVRGAYIDGRIHINAELADRTTVGHETFHALFLQNTGNDQVAGIRSRELLDTVFRATTDEQLKSYIADFSSNYEANLQSEEALAQMFGVLSANYKPLDVSTKTKIKAWFANVARSLGLDGLFTEATTDVDIINAFNTMAQGVARGENIGNTNFKILGESSTDVKTRQQRRFEINYVDENTGLDFGYFQNSPTFKQAVEEGRVTFNRKLKDFTVPATLHMPDNFFTGSIKQDGVELAKGGGGIFFPLNTNYFWASTKGSVSTMVNQLNRQIEMTGNDTVRLVLTSAPAKKLESSSDYLKGIAKTTYRAVNATLPDKYKNQFDKDFREALSLASKELSLKNINFKKDSIETIFSELDKQVTPQSGFKRRGKFSRAFIKHIANISQHHSRDLGKDLYPVKVQESMMNLFGASKATQRSEYYKNTKVNPNNVNKAYGKGFQYMLSEPLLREFDPDFSIPTERAYAVIEMYAPNKVEAVSIEGENASYDTAIQAVGINSKPTVHILSDRVKWSDFYQYKDKGYKNEDGIPRSTDRHILPTTSGVSTEVLDSYNKNYDAFDISKEDLFQGMTRDNVDIQELYDAFKKQDLMRFQVADGFEFTDQEAINALPAKEKSKYNAHLANRIPQGAVRLNLGSRFIKDDKPHFVQTLHPVSTKSGKANYGVAHSYSRSFTLKNATFAVNPLATALIKNKVSDKFPMASVNGEIDYQTEGSLEGEVLSFNPFKHIAFVDSEGRFVKSVEEVTVYGSKAYARGKIEYMEDTPEQVSLDQVASFIRGETYTHPVFHPRGIKAGANIKNKQEFLKAYDKATAETERRRQAQTADILRMQKLPDETFEQARNRILDKHNMRTEFDGVAQLLQYLYEGGKAQGIDVSYLENYFPRLVKDARGLQDSFRGKYYDTEIDREIAEIERKRDVMMSEAERLRLIENMITRKSIKFGMRTQPSQMRERKIDVIDRERRKKYYGSSEEALGNYVESLIASIAQKKLINTTAQLMDRDRANGTLSAEAEGLINEAINARFGQHGKQSQIIKGLKNAGYIATMGNVGSAITQLGDFYFTAVQTGLGNTLKGAFQATGKDKITREDVMGLKNIVTAEAQDGAGALQNAVDFFFKASGITQIDAFAKTTNINANYNAMRKAVRKFDSKEYKKLYNELVKFQGVNDANKAISDLQSGIKSDQVLQALYNRLANVAPISLSEMPLNYSQNPNGRILYSLKSYTIKQFDFIRQQSFQKMQKRDTFAEGFTQLFRIAMLSMLANGSADVLKAILFNREIDEEEFFWNNILRMFGITKFTTVKARKEGLGSALVGTVLPPQIGMINDVTKDFDRAVTEGEFEVDELRSVKYIPIVGKLYYWREGRGVDVEERLSRLRD